MNACIIFLSIIVSVCSCKPKESPKQIDIPKIREIILNGGFVDTCVWLKSVNGDSINYNRDIEIVENSFLDTLNVGFAAVPAGKTGKLFIAQNGISHSSSLDNSPEFIDWVRKGNNPFYKTKIFCIYHYSKNHINVPGQRLRIKVIAEE